MFSSAIMGVSFGSLMSALTPSAATPAKRSAKWIAALLHRRARAADRSNGNHVTLFQTFQDLVTRVVGNSNMHLRGLQFDAPTLRGLRADEIRGSERRQFARTLATASGTTWT